MKKNNRSLRRLAAGLTLGSVVLAGCSVLPKPEALNVYRLPSSSTVIPDAASRQALPVTWALRVDTPYSNQLINSERILVQPSGNQVSVYKGARWSDTAPVLLRDRLVDAFRADAPGVLVSSEGDRLHSDRRLKGDLAVFQVTYSDGEPVVHIRFDAVVVDSAGSRALAARRFEVRQPVSDSQVAGVVAAFGTAVDTLAGQLVSWTLGHAPP